MADVTLDKRAFVKEKSSSTMSATGDESSTGDDDHDSKLERTSHDPSDDVDFTFTGALTDGLNMLRDVVKFLCTVKFSVFVAILGSAIIIGFSAMDGDICIQTANISSVRNVTSLRNVTIGNVTSLRNVTGPVTRWTPEITCLKSEAYWVLALYLYALIVMANDAPPDLVMLAFTIVLIFSKIIADKDAWSGFCSTSILAIASLHVMCRALEETKAVEAVILPILGNPSNHFSAILRLTLPVICLSAFLNNTPIVAMLMGVCENWAARSNLSVKCLLMPLSYAALLGGCCTLIGTSTNLVLNGLIKDDKNPPMKPFTLVRVKYVHRHTFTVRGRGPRTAQDNAKRKMRHAIGLAPRHHASAAHREARGRIGCELSGSDARTRFGHLHHVTMNAFPAADDDAYLDAPIEELKAHMSIARASNDRAKLSELVDALEALNPTDRCATSPLLDGYWETVYASPEPCWARGRPVLHVIESWCPQNLGPGAPGVLANPRGELWSDVAKGRGAYVQRARLRWGTIELRATYQWLGGESWDVEFVSRARLLFGLPLWRAPLLAPLPSDLDHGVRPTYVDGELCILRAPACTAGQTTLRSERVYLLRRRRNRLWQDGSFKGLSDRPLVGFDLDP